MQRYPPLNEYNSAVQHPRIAFSDSELKGGKVETTGLGLPRALGGGFAITYTIAAGNKKYAVRCFHKPAPDIEQKYRCISSALSGDKSGYFVGFEYESNGVLVNGTRFPIVKMDWAEGKTLGAWLENNEKNQAKLAQLRQQFQALETYLRSKSYAHGDLQNGNVIVNGSAKLIDYDGLYVPGLHVGQGAELGHKHFQHPDRSFVDFGPQMDRFSFIVIDLSLHAVLEVPSLFQKYSNGENIIFCASDFRDPSQSGVFQDLFNNTALKDSALNFARVCTAPIKDVPTLGEFLAGRNISARVILISPPTKGRPSASSAYIGAFDIVDALDVVDLGARVGDRIELVGRIEEVRKGRTKHGKPYIFLNFGNWRSNQAKINIWSEGLSILMLTPDASWKGKWISVTGLVDPPYMNRKIGCTHLSITITEANQLRTIDEAEAHRRLVASKNGAKGSVGSNTAILKGLNKQPVHPIPKGGTGQSAIPTGLGGNQSILTVLRGTTSTGPITPGQQGPSTKVSVSPHKGRLIKWGIAAAIAFFVLIKIFSSQAPAPRDGKLSDRAPFPPVANSNTPSAQTTAPKSEPSPFSKGIATVSPPAATLEPNFAPQRPPQPITSQPGVEAPPLPPPVEISPAPGAGSSRDTGSEHSVSRQSTSVPSNTEAPTAVTSAVFIGGWASDKNACGSRESDSPLIITQREAKTAKGACEFDSMQRYGTAWRVKANCAVGQEKWVANITMTVSGNRLTWSSERGMAVYIRCPRN